MDQQLIFEIGTEEIPASYLSPALNALKENISQSLNDLNLTYKEIKGAATPRRLVVCIENLQDCQPDITEEILGPPKKAAFDADNNPTKAAEGFAKSRGATLNDIKIATTEKGEYLMIVQEKKGRQTKELLPDLLSEMINKVPFPKSMRWGSTKTSFARPIQWLLAIYNGKTIPFSYPGAGEASNITYGHRFMAPGAIVVSNFNQYVDDLREHHVLVDIDERRKAVREEITREAQEAGGSILPDEELVETVANLVEIPHAICGSFDQKFLELPKDALITSMREHQKYFAVVDDSHSLRANFIAVNNTKVKDKKLGAEGHQRVIRARLEDGLFFFKEDQNRALADRVNDLEGILFQAKLGTMLEKTKRIEQLAIYLSEVLCPGKTEQVKRAARLSKADLLTEMVNEFPSLQGAMGRDYAFLNGEKPEVANAIIEHYMPVRAGSTLPESDIGAIVSLADRIDTIAGCFGIGQVPSGTADPFGLRRLAIGLIRIIDHKNFSLSIDQLLDKALVLYGDKITQEMSQAKESALEFIKGRFINDQVGQGTPTETVDAVTSVTFDDITDCSLRIKALTAISDQPSFPLLAGAFKRVMNIIKDHKSTALDISLLEEDEEKGLYQTYLQVNQESQPLIDANNYLDAMKSILQMKEPVDLFFDKVMVMTDNKKVRENRLNLLSLIASLFLQVGNFSKMNT